MAVDPAYSRRERESRIWNAHYEARQFASAIDWLCEKGVSGDRLAALFETTTENIRVIAHRYRRQRLDKEWLAPFIPDLHGAVPESFFGSLGLRPFDDFTGRGGLLLTPVDVLEAAILTKLSEFARAYQFREAAAFLKQQIPIIGFTSDPHRTALAGLVYQKLAWFLVHHGRSVSAVEQATRSLYLLQIAFWETGRRIYAARFVQSALIASHANLLARRPQAALQILDLAADAAAHIGDRLGSDHFRQRGVAMFQLGRDYDREATELFLRSHRVMEELGEAQNEAQLLMTGYRHVYLMNSPNWEKASEILDKVQRSFGNESLELSMTQHWTAAAGLITDSPAARLGAREFIQQNQANAQRFGHQASLNKLLSITPELDLYPRLQSEWVRRALYSNAFRLD